MSAALPPLVSWSGEFLAARASVAGAYFLADQLPLGDHVGILCAGSRLADLWEQLPVWLDEARRLVAVAPIPERRDCLALLDQDGGRVQWELERTESWQPRARLRDARWLCGPRALERVVTASRTILRGGSAAELAEADRLFWIEVTLAADLIAGFQVGAAELALERLQGHAWRWIDVREMEKELREGCFPALPEPLAGRGERGEVAVLTASLKEWIAFYRQLRARIAPRAGIRLQDRVERTARRHLARRLRELREH